MNVGKKADLIIEKLLVEEDRPDHIARHNVSISEVLEVLEADYIYTKGKQERLLLIGKTKAKRFLAIIIGERRTKKVYGLVTARDAKKKEKQLYIEFVYQVGDEENDQSSNS